MRKDFPRNKFCKALSASSHLKRLHLQGAPLNSRGKRISLSPPRSLYGGGHVVNSVHVRVRPFRLWSGRSVGVCGIYKRRLSPNASYVLLSDRGGSARPCLNACLPSGGGPIKRRHNAVTRKRPKRIKAASSPSLLAYLDRRSRVPFVIPNSDPSQSDLSTY